jgi:hypothetical protein
VTRREDALSVGESLLEDALPLQKRLRTLIFAAVAEDVPSENRRRALVVGASCRLAGSRSAPAQVVELRPAEDIKDHQLAIDRSSIRQPIEFGDQLGERMRQILPMAGGHLR